MNIPETTWFGTSLGRWLLEEECGRCRKLIPAGYYPSALQIGLPERNYFRALDDVEVGTRFLALPTLESMSLMEHGPGGDNDAQAFRAMIAQPGALPFGEKAHSLIVLPHALDFCDDPHRVLREVNQILVPEGCVVITGFNQISLWGLHRLASGSRFGNVRPLPWSGRQHYRAGRVQDWLSLLGIDIVGACMLAYQLPLQNPRWRDKLDFMDRMGGRWWPGLGAVYMIVGRKREFASGASGKRLAWRRFIPAIARPAVTASRIPVSHAGTSPRDRLRLVSDDLARNA
ncbi:MAG: methyltransferase domain-containing protein [Gammaproteobacteria bacterium]|nr:methyltransferase domain-containing protein [Gammaproteobacteria bacterium]